LVSSIQDLTMEEVAPEPAAGTPAGRTPAGRTPTDLFVCSAGHSGSTLLEMLLAGHPEMVAIGELHNLSHQLRVGRPCSCGAVPARCPRWQAVAAAIHARRGIDVFQRPLEFRVSRERPRTYKERWARLWNRALYYGHFHDGLLARLGLPRLALGGEALAANTALVVEVVRELTGARIVIDSSKDYVRMRERYDPLPRGSVKVVYLQRDGRGPVASALRMGIGIEEASRNWVRTQRRIRKMLGGVRPEDWTSLRYESLCADPEGALRRLCVLLGVEYAPAMLALSPREHHTIAGNRIRLRRGMAITLDERWRRTLSRAQQATFERIAGAENRRQGYPPA
jgi:hypothetical protein